MPASLRRLMARGSILARRRKDGSEVFDIKYRTTDGTQVKRVVGSSRREAERALNAALASVDRGEERTVSRDRFEDYIDAWLLEHRSRIEPGTYRDYDTHIRRRLRPFFGEKRLTTISPPDVRRYVTAQRDAGLSPKTINNSLTVLRTALEHALEDGLLRSNPASSAGRRDRVKLPVEHREMDYLRLAEIQPYLNACAGDYGPLAEVLIGTGLRISEALALEWGDVDWRGKALVIRRGLKREGPGSTKGDRARRVELGPRLLGRLADRRAIQGEHGTAAEGSALIFPGKGRGARQGYRDRSHASRTLHRDALKNAGLRQTIRLHDLRHTAAASWLAVPLPMIYVQRQLGHRNIGTTIDLYGHLEEGFLRDAATRAEAAIFEVASPPP